MERSGTTKAFTESAQKRNSFFEYALTKSTGNPLSSSSKHHLHHHPDDGLLDIDDEPTPTSPSAFVSVSIPISRIPDNLIPHNRGPSTGLSPIGSPQSLGEELSCHLDLVAAARREHEHCVCGTTEEKKEFKARWVPILLNRLRELSEMEGKSAVGVEIADTIDFLKTLYVSESVLKEIGEMSDKSRQGVIRLQEGLLLVDKAKEQLRYALQKKLFSAD
ncbi:unnamed protein product [Linum tenue]|uniref:Uncharacterized protein n=1 Tax=Linum tenue TaxID=586396 RepID=A0AAV0NRJ4_9ROSI|nr:unnamed protein product [Linum tenue]